MSKEPNQLQQLIAGATEGLLPMHARRLHKTIVAAYWLGVEDGQKFGATHGHPEIKLRASVPLREGQDHSD